MKKIVHATKRRWNLKVFFVLIALIIPATFAILPYALNLQNVSFGWDILLLDRLIFIFLYSVLGGIGLIVANRIGLGMPLVEAWIKRESAPYRFRHIIAIAWITAVVLVLLSVFLHTVVLDPPLYAMLEKLRILIPEGAHTPPLYGFLAATSAAITEETLYRLFGLSLLAWLGGLLFHDSEGRPKMVVFWTANLVLAVAFSMAHLSKAAAIGWPINTFVVIYTLVFNSIGGMTFGWIFWTFGLESAIWTHFFADVIMYTLIPFIEIQEGETAKYLATIGVIILILAALIWAWRTLIIKQRTHSKSIESKGVQHADE